MADEQPKSEDEKREGDLKNFSLSPVMTALFKPTADYLGKELKIFVEEKVRNWKADKRRKNLRTHLENVRVIIESQTATTPLLEFTNLRQADFFSDWTNTVEEVDSSDKELSKLWEDLMVRLLSGEDISEELVSKLKSISPNEARVLLNIRNQGPLKPSFRLISKKDLYYIEQLHSKKLVARSNLHYWMTVIFALAVLSTFMSVLVGSRKMGWTGNSTEMLRLITLFSPFLFLYFAIGRTLPHWSLTWLGKELTKFADKAKKK